MLNLTNVLPHTHTQFEETGARMTKDFIITREQVRAKPSWFDQELRNWSRAPPYVSISVLQECYYLQVYSMSN